MIRPFFLAKSLLVPLRQFWPRKLLNKIALSMAMVLVVTILGLTWYAWSEKHAYQLAEIMKQYREYASQLANVSKKNIDANQFDELEEVIRSFMMIHDEYDLFITDVGFNSLVALHHDKDDQSTNITDHARSIAPIESGESVVVKNGHLELWLQIDSSKPVGWIHIQRVINPLEGLPLSYIKTTITALILSLALCITLLHRILREPMRSLRRAAEFSEWLDLVQGNNLQLQSSSKEVESLVNAINKASERMFQKGLQDKRKQLLSDAIRDVQARYIEGASIPELNSCILNKVVQLSESEYGFFGEIKKSLRGKPYIKMRNFTKLSENVLMQNFIEKYMPINMEFHSQQNLFGAVLQTNKAVITNEPQRDPRRGGLPSGHPPLHTFMALPVFNKDKLVAVIGLANRRAGYDHDLESYLLPLLTSIGGIVVAIRNDRKRDYLMRQHEQKEVLFKNILETVTDSVVTINMGGFIETVNLASEKMFGYLSENMFGLHINRIIPDLFTPTFSDKYINEQDAIYHKSEGIRKDGARFSIEFTVNAFTIDDEKLFTVTIIDISNLNLNAAVADQTDLSLNEMQRMISAGTWELNIKNSEFKATDNVYAIFGAQRGNGKNNFDAVIQCLSDEDRQIVNLAIEQCTTNNEPFIVDVKIKTDDKVPRFAQIQGRPQYLSDTKTLKIVGVVQDITDSRKLMLKKDEFITSVSEEIRSPLASIRGSIGLLLTEVAKFVSEKEKFLLDSAYQISDRLLIFLNDILDIENMVTGRTEFRMEFLECSKLMKNVIDANNALAKQYKVKINLNVRSKEIVLIADKHRMMQLLSILLSNAAKHSPLNSQVDVVVENLENSLVIMVRDYGEGIPSELQDKVFDLYSRIRCLRSDHPESTGFGLCIAKSIVDKHKGNITVVSEQGKGTTITVRLPIPQQNIAVLNL